MAALTSPLVSSGPSSNESRVCIRQTHGKGRGLFSLSRFSTGETIATEEPLVCAQFLWNALYGYSACQHCLRNLETAEENARRLSGKADLVLPHTADDGGDQGREGVHPVPCPQCQVRYCSEECRDKAWNSYHRVLCSAGGQGEEASANPVLRLEEYWRSIHYPPETASISLLIRAAALVKQACDEDKAKLVRLFDAFCSRTRSDDEELAHKLLGPQFKDQIEELRRLYTKAVYDPAIEAWFTPEGFRSLLAMLGRNGQGIGTSSLSMWVHKCDELDIPPEERKTLDSFINQLYADIETVTGDFLDCEGSGMYVLQSAANHSCIPNAEIQFLRNNSTLSLVATRDIEEEEEIYICYLDECARSRSRHSRQKLLRENYLFSCHCQRCQDEAEQPDNTSDEEVDDDDDEEQEMMDSFS